jgi:hypothetical protein
MAAQMLMVSRATILVCVALPAATDIALLVRASALQMEHLEILLRETEGTDVLRMA